MVRVALWWMAVLTSVAAALCLWPLPSIRVAHAGGGLPEGIYCNCREAFDRSYARGFRWFEADFSTTTDGQIVLLHDWGPEFRSWFNRPGPLTHAEFMATMLRGGYHPMDVGSLVAWLTAHPDAILITDVKADNLTILHQLAATPIKSQLVPQVYFPDQIAPVKALGFDRIIFTNYRANLPASDLRKIMPKVWAVTVWKDDVRHLGGRVFAFTVNTTAEANLARLRGAAGVYTDQLRP